MTSVQENELSWKHILNQLLVPQDLDRKAASWAMDRIMSGEAADSHIAAFLIALKAKGETVDELRGLADTMLDHALAVNVDEPVVDIVGTGGDRAHTVNISTMASLVVAGAGHKVVKHGNRAASSSSGSADVLESLGVNLDVGPDQAVRILAQAGITFCFARVYHPSMRFVASVRKELGVPTVFNSLGPLTNPARPSSLAVGVADKRIAPLVAGVFADRGTKALVFRGDDGLDELTTTGPSEVWVISGGNFIRTAIDPLDFGIPRSSLDDLRGGLPEHNAQVARDFLAGSQGPVRDIVLANAAAAIASAKLPDGEPSAEVFTALFAQGLIEAAESVDSGAAGSVLSRWVEVSSD